MDSLAVEDGRQRLARWIEDGQSVLGVVPWLFEENERLRAAIEAAERECARLREELHAVRAETDFLIGERGEIAEMIAAGLNKVMNDALQRLRAPFASRALERTPGERHPLLQPEPTYS